MRRRRRWAALALAGGALAVASVVHLASNSVAPSSAGEGSGPNVTITTGPNGQVTSVASTVPVQLP